MKDVTITAKNGKDKESPAASVVIKFPETIEEAIQLYGGPAILSNALANWTITLQSNIRRYLTSGIKAEDIQAKLAGAKMGVALERVAGDPKVAMMAKFQAMTPEEKAAFIKELQKTAAAK